MRSALRLTVHVNVLSHFPLISHIDRRRVNLAPHFPHRLPTREPRVGVGALGRGWGACHQHAHTYVRQPSRERELHTSQRFVDRAIRSPERASSACTPYAIASPRRVGPHRIPGQQCQVYCSQVSNANRQLASHSTQHSLSA